MSKRNDTKEVLAEELSRQKLFTLDLYEIMKTRAKGIIPLAYVRTYGCQQNVADGEKIKGMLAEMGFGFTENDAEADFIIFNTCAIREHAEDRVFGNIGALKNLKRKNPQLMIAVCGCMMEQEHVADRIKKSFPFVNIVFGTHVIHRLPEIMYKNIVDSKRVFIRGHEQTEIAEGLPIRRDGDLKAFISIMYGCDNFCSYCIVPYVRGREKSRHSAEIIKEFKQLVSEGYKEITLLGQNVNSYGKGLDEDVDFPKLLRELDKTPGDYKIRFMSAHPKDATHEMFDVIAESEHISHHIHLPFQSGNNRVLGEMNRRYTRESYLELINYAKKVILDVSFTSDVIVGFPGETYEEFLDTVSLIKEIEYISLFTFIYSSRVGTRASKMDDPISADDKSIWFRELLEVQENISSNNLSKTVGQVKKAFAEEYNEEKGKIFARLESNVIVEFDGEKELVGQNCMVEITEARNYVLKAKLLK